MKFIKWMQLGTIVFVLFGAMTVGAEDKVPLKTDLPKPVFIGTQVPLTVPNLEPARQEPPPDLMVPAGTTNLAKEKKVTSSDSQPVIGTLDMITDGDKAADEGCYVELGPSKQWIQIDLGQKAEIYAVWVWHYHAQARVYHDLIVQIGDDPDFLSGVTTIFNNDHDNSSGMGIGKDYAYVETNKGKLVDAKGAQGRYVRLYSNGNTANRMNHYIEVEVFGKPAK